MFGTLNRVTNVTNCYGIGGLYEIGKDHGGTSIVTREGVVGKNIGLIASIVLDDNYSKEIRGFDNVYGVMNGKLLYVIKSSSLTLNEVNQSAIDKIITNTNPKNEISNCFLFLKNVNKENTQNSTTVIPKPQWAKALCKFLFLISISVVPWLYGKIEDKVNTIKAITETIIKNVL